jgi:hypothetical protein
MGIDVLEEDILHLGEPLLKIILKDRTTKKNIIWATTDYETLGSGFEAEAEITIPKITGINMNVIQPRIIKSKKDQTGRTKNKAEVFTPAWLCNEQLNLVDDQWFGYKNAFNVSLNNTWRINPNKIFFQKERKKSWSSYVDSSRLEIACGEAPYITSRYDAVSGKLIDVKRRIGILDRKLRVVNENTIREDDWLKWTIRAYQSVYAYEYQGDNLLLARENLLYTFIDNKKLKFGKLPTLKELEIIAHIISWNIWQMDGISLTVPFGKNGSQSYMSNLFDEMELVPPRQQVCRIHDWRSKVTTTYKELSLGEKIR